MSQFFNTLKSNIKEEFNLLFRQKHINTLSLICSNKFDVRIGLTLFIVFFILYSVLAFRLAQGDFLFYYNYGFDLDPARFVAMFAGDHSLYPERFVKGGPKHPLLYLLHPLAWPFQLAGFDVRTSASLAKAIIGSGTVVLVFNFFRLTRLPRVESICLTLLFGISSSQLFNAFIIDSYGFALFFIAFVWCLTPLRMHSPNQLIRFRLVVSVMNIGTTVTNGVHSLISEIMIWYQNRPLVSALNRTLAFFLFVGGIFFILIVLVWNDQLLKIIADPIGAMKNLYWQNPKGEKLGIEHVLISFFAHSFVSPEFTIIRLPEGIDMHDFRGWYKSTSGSLAFILWITLLITSITVGLWQKEIRPLILSLLVVTLFNVFFHLSYQYRGSIYLYSAHSHFPIFAMLLGSAYFFSRKNISWRIVFNSYILLLTLLIGIINVDRAFNFVTLFDNLNPPTPRLLLEH